MVSLFWPCGRRKTASPPGGAVFLSRILPAKVSVTTAGSLALVLAATMPNSPTLAVDHRFTGKKLQPSLPAASASQGVRQSPPMQVSL